MTNKNTTCAHLTAGEFGSHERSCPFQLLYIQLGGLLVQEHAQLHAERAPRKLPAMLQWYKPWGSMDHNGRVVMWQGEL